MSEPIYEQAERAIKHGWFVQTGRRWCGSVQVHYVLRIEHGNIIVQLYDHAYAQEQMWTTDDWRKYVSEDGDGLLVKVGLYDFESINNPAADDIRWAHQNPHACGRLLYEKKQRIKELEKEIEGLKREAKK